MAAILSEKGKQVQATRSMLQRDPVRGRAMFNKVWKSTDPYFFDITHKADNKYSNDLNNVDKNTVRTWKKTMVVVDNIPTWFYSGNNIDGTKTYIPVKKWDKYISNINATLLRDNSEKVEKANA